MSENKVLVKSLINFIEYEDVEPYVGPIKRIGNTIDSRFLFSDEQPMIKYSFVEHRIRLEDSLS